MTNARLDALLEERRPKRADARRNFDALIDAARAAFTADGLDASLDDIARRAGVGIGTLYRNFATRDALVEAVYVEGVAQVAAYANDLEEGPPFEQFAAWLRRFAEYASTKRVLLDGLNRESPLLRSCRGIVFDSAEPLLRRAQDAGEARPDVTIDDAVRLVSGVSAIELPDPVQRQRLLELAIDGLRIR
jgi:AcrR family transcriptional regulator